MYIDDILIYSKTDKQHIELVHWVLQRFMENNICIKCHGVTTGPSKGTCAIQNDPRICYTCLRNTL